MEHRCNVVEFVPHLASRRRNSKTHPRHLDFHTTEWGGNTGTTNSLPSHVHVNPLRHGDHPDLGHLRTTVASQMSTVQQPAQLLITLLRRLKEVCQQERTYLKMDQITYSNT